MRVLRSERDSLHVRRDSVLYIPAVTAGHRDRNRNTGAMRAIEDRPVASGEAGHRQLQTSEPIALVGIGSGKVDDQMRGKAPEQFSQRAVQRFQIDIVAGTVGKRDIKVADLFFERIVMLAMQRQREYRIVAIALVDIEVDNGDALHAALSLHQSRCDRGIVEHAKTLAVISVCVMRSAGKIGCDAIRERSAARGNRRARRAARTLYHLQCPRKTDRPLLGSRQGAIGNAIYIVGMMRERQHAIGGERCFVKLDAGHCGQYPLPHQTVFLHRKTVAGREGQNEMVAVKDFQGCDAD
jgi:hypothetical protein